MGCSQTVSHNLSVASRPAPPTACCRRAWAATRGADELCGKRFERLHRQRFGRLAIHAQLPSGQHSRVPEEQPVRPAHQDVPHRSDRQNVAPSTRVMASPPNPMRTGSAALSTSGRAVMRWRLSRCSSARVCALHRRAAVSVGGSTNPRRRQLLIDLLVSRTELRHTEVGGDMAPAGGRVQRRRPLDRGR